MPCDHGNGILRLCNGHINLLRSALIADQPDRPDQTQQRDGTKSQCRRPQSQLQFLPKSDFRSFNDSWFHRWIAVCVLIKCTGKSHFLPPLWCRHIERLEFFRSNRVETAVYIRIDEIVLDVPQKSVKAIVNKRKLVVSERFLFGQRTE